MCGIVGYMTSEGQRDAVKRDKFMRQALIMDTLRGHDSTGIYAVRDGDDKGTTPAWFKQLGSGFEFIDTYDYRAFEKYLYKYAVGHNRAATIGDIVVDNAHPFQEGPITLVHNGSLWGTGLLPKSLKELGVEVDSHAICHNLAIAPVEDVIERLDGAFVLVWHDSRDDTLNIVRNSERPFHMAQVRGEKTIVFMSEAEMLYAVTSRLKMPLLDIVYPKPGQWLKFSEEDLLHPEIKQLDVSTSYRSYYQGVRANKYYNYDWYDTDTDDDDTLPASNVHQLPVPSRGVRSPQPPAPSDNRIFVGGRRREVPRTAQEMLLEVGYLVEQRLPFVPVSCSTEAGKSNVVVSGYAGKDGITGVVYNVKKGLFDRCKDRTWTVRPIAVKYMDEDEPCLICKVVSTMGKPEAPSLAEQGPAASLPESSKHSSTDREWDMVRGPGGVYVTVDAFNNMVAGGCISCTGSVSHYDADEIQWVNETRDPLCPRCVNDYEERYGAYTNSTLSTWE